MNRSQQQIAPIYLRRIGDVTVTALSDGAVQRTHEMMNDVSKDEGDKYLAAEFRKEFVLSINAFLIHAGDRLALIETGSGNYLGPDCGKLLGNLKIADIAPDKIDTILLTHMHPDHSAGLTDMATGKPNTTLMLNWWYIKTSPTTGSMTPLWRAPQSVKNY